ncbi:unnamed protein product [Linum tenue]|uniref:Uncharacterized protein n=2 Tax=Linum tenue TaxID=586396 RepID=A0AAV0Q0S8_9ROSI|nr:unnamed protein product [Linum tenue]
MILVSNPSKEDVPEPELHVLPASYISFADGELVKSYINSSISSPLSSPPTAKITFQGTVLGLPYAPQVAVFSSRGPNSASPGILKPDILGPGVLVLAAWPTSKDGNNKTKSTFNVISGTSMSCPHLAGIAALLKSSHPDWSPAAIKSAIMTTADRTSLAGGRADLFATGSGQVNPNKANDPGLVYDLQPDDYISYLCGLGYNVEAIVQRKVSCEKNYSSTAEAELNYPSFSITLSSDNPQSYTRTVTNVGAAKSGYKCEILGLQGVDVKVTPCEIGFTEVNQKVRFSVMFRRRGKYSRPSDQGYLRWVSSDHNVTSPIAVKFAIEGHQIIGKD